MERKIITTSDGSKTIQIKDWNEQYHSIHGALQEALHVFIKTGLHHYLRLFRPKSIRILEIGFGTGLNAILTQIEAEKEFVKIGYTGIEAYPVEASEIEQLNYTDIIPECESDIFTKIHKTEWEDFQDISKYFELKKEQKFFKDITVQSEFDIIYFDAFGARVQPELWTEDIFQIMFNALKANGILVTYSAKGSVRRAMEAVGFSVERLPGPPGKREMLRASKRIS
ncbi:tRNA (5-methylaminomethyl-2-thiouridine)(34)-methyltransferase MnmD [Winogradskyella maritima]|uniref:tRNA (5-methylaminomethyl-2-thiouridine)(34)-methyltransferase MnmD n=1 Tax=Winogradskyella maritima TaxID=1517766 RepID=A0ABV8AN25_9FLAO|nr:tRNA (5-methylaminomethyl-2-thiouridine)(34)-methyltransferase MnmD [Winogradskyella maritima]